MAIAAGTLSQVYKEMGNYKDALQMQELHTEMEDSINTKKQAIEIATLENEAHENELKADEEKKIAADKVAQAIQAQELKKQRVLRYVIIICFIFLSLISFIILRARVHRLNEENLKAEVRYLKSQMNPHFLFNILNSIHVLTQLQPQMAGEIILKLSDMLYYQLYDCAEDKVLLQQEINYLESYIELQKTRYEHKLELTFDKKSSDETITIAPLLLLPLIENAFKHGVEPSSENAFIHILLQGERGKVYMTVENSKPPVVAKQVAKGGIGLQNVRKRLNMLYPGKHHLTITETPERYKIILTLELV